MTSFRERIESITRDQLKERTTLGEQIKGLHKANLETQLDGIGGVYCENCEVAAPTDDGENARFIGVNDWAVDSEEASRLWDETERMLS